MNIGKQITNLRKNKNLTQENLADLLFISSKTISSWEQNRTTPSIEDLIKLSEILECPLSELIYNQIEKNNIELEIKIKLTETEYKDLNDLLNKNAKFINETHHKDTYYEPSHRRFYNKNKKVTEWLRIGERGNKNILNYKKWYELYCDEFEVEIDNTENLLKIFDALGIEELIQVDKKRKSYLYKNKYEIDLDNVKNLGYFVELEVKKYDKDIINEYDDLIKIIKSLNLNINNITKKGYSHIMLDSL